MARTETQQSSRRPARRGIALLTIALLGVAIAKELRQPRDERTWHGVLFGFVPYDLRVPTLDRLRRSLWAPDDDRLVLPRAFGIGWSPNFARLVALGRQVLGTN
jgi:hypothetical protein